MIAAVSPWMAGARAVPLELLMLLLLLGLLIFMWDWFDRKSRKITVDSGLEDNTTLISVQGSSCLPSRRFFSPVSRLVSKPDALLKAEGAFIPVDVKPLSTKVRDRHVIALLFHMRVIEEVEGVRPPYGILLMGAEQRMVKIKNSEEKRLWLDAILAEMRSIEDGIPTIPAPQPFKCRNCDVRQICDFSTEHTSRSRRQEKPR